MHRTSAHVLLYGVSVGSHREPPCAPAAGPSRMRFPCHALTPLPSSSPSPPPPAPLSPRPPRAGQPHRARLLQRPRGGFGWGRSPRLWGLPARFGLAEEPPAPPGRSLAAKLGTCGSRVPPPCAGSDPRTGPTGCPVRVPRLVPSQNNPVGLARAQGGRGGCTVGRAGRGDCPPASPRTPHTGLWQGRAWGMPGWGEAPGGATHPPRHPACGIAQAPRHSRQPLAAAERSGSQAAAPYLPQDGNGGGSGASMSQGSGFVCCSPGHHTAEQGTGAGSRGKVEEGTWGQLRGAGNPGAAQDAGARRPDPPPAPGCPHGEVRG